MLLQEGLTHIHSQKKPKLHFGESFALINWPTVQSVTQPTVLRSFTVKDPAHLKSISTSQNHWQARSNLMSDQLLDQDRPGIDKKSQHN